MCSRIFAGTDHGYCVVRTCDWDTKLGALMDISIAGQERESLATPEYRRTAGWEVKFRTVGLCDNETFAGTVTEAVNERGLSASILYQEGCEAYYTRHKDSGAPAVNLHNLVGYLAENYASVNEALDALRQNLFQVAWKSTVIPPDHTEHGTLHGVHFSIQDKSGHIVLVQFGPDGQVIYDNLKGDDDIVVMTNEPLQPTMREFNAEVIKSEDLLGDISPKGRNQRLSFFLPQLKLQGLSPAQTEGRLSSLMDAAVVPFDVVDDGTGLPYPTQWKIQYNLKTLEFVFKNYDVNRQLRFSWQELDELKNPFQIDLIAQTEQLKPELELGVD